MHNLAVTTKLIQMISNKLIVAKDAELIQSLFEPSAL